MISCVQDTLKSIELTFEFSRRQALNFEVLYHMNFYSDISENIKHRSYVLTFIFNGVQFNGVWGTENMPYSSLLL